MAKLKKTATKKYCDQHTFVQGPVNRTEKEYGVVRRNRKCPDCGHYYWTEERTVDVNNQLAKDHGEEKMKLAFEIDKLRQLIDRCVEVEKYRAKNNELMKEVAAER